MVGLLQLLLRETGLAVLLGLLAVSFGGGSGSIYFAMGFILSLAFAGVYAMGQSMLRRIPSGLQLALGALLWAGLAWRLPFKTVPPLDPWPTVLTPSGLVARLFPYGLTSAPRSCWPTACLGATGPRPLAAPSSGPLPASC
jgi:hypothetical protein